MTKLQLNQQLKVWTPFILAIVTFVSGLAQGETESKIVVAPNQFFASDCGKTSTENGMVISVESFVERVCVGSVFESAGVQLEGMAVQLVFKDGSFKRYRVSRVDNLLIAFLSGETKSTYYLIADDGERAYLKVVKSAEGQIIKAQGAIGGMPFLVGSFEQLVHPL